MLLGPLQLSDSLNRHYQISGPGLHQLPHSAAQRLTFNDQSSAVSFFKLFDESDSRWKRLLRECAPHIARNARASALALLAKLAVSGAISIYRLPDISSMPTVHDGDGSGFSFFRGPDVLSHVRGDPLVLESQAEAAKLIDSLNGDLNYWQQVLQTAGFDAGESDMAELKQKLADFLVEGTLCAYIYPFTPATPVSGEPVIDKVAASAVSPPPPPPPASASPATAPAASNQQAAANDQADQSQALVDASENGDAFCEECQSEKKAAG